MQAISCKIGLYSDMKSFRVLAHGDFKERLQYIRSLLMMMINHHHQLIYDNNKYN